MHIVDDTGTEGEALPLTPEVYLLCGGATKPRMLPVAAVWASCRFLSEHRRHARRQVLERRGLPPVRRRDAAVDTRRRHARRCRDLPTFKALVVSARLTGRVG